MNTKTSQVLTNLPCWSTLPEGVWARTNRVEFVTVVEKVSEPVKKVSKPTISPRVTLYRSIIGPYITAKGRTETEGQALKNVIAKYAPSLREIPLEKHEAFLTELKEFCSK